MAYACGCSGAVRRALTGFGPIFWAPRDLHPSGGGEGRAILSWKRASIRDWGGRRGETRKGGGGGVARREPKAFTNRPNKNRYLYGGARARGGARVGFSAIADGRFSNQGSGGGQKKPCG